MTRFLTRFFVGTFLDPVEAARIGRFASANLEKCYAIQQSGSRPRFLPPEKLHMTWLFLGETPTANLDHVSEWLTGEVEHLKNKLGQNLDYSVEYTHLECWPQENTARVLVARPGHVPAPVAEIGDHLRLSFEEYRREYPTHFALSAQEERYPEFKPHLTLMRFGRGADLSDGKLSQFLATLLPVPSRITKMALIETRDSSYQVIKQLW